MSSLIEYPTGMWVAGAWLGHEEKGSQRFIFYVKDGFVSQNLR